ncbi:MAG: IPT/TIG domain-containing protein, partial [Myxococcales bacterium]
MRLRGACLLVCAVGCARDLSVPNPLNRPVITSFSPTSAFAQAELTIKGKNFDPVATNNLVQFVAKSVRAHDMTADGDLLVTVPDGTYADLIGKISVSNDNGLSDPSAVEFGYMGRGHPFLGTEVGTTRFLHRPPGVAVLSGEVVVASTAAWAAMGSNGLFVPLGGEPTALAGLPDESAAFAAAGGKVSSIAAGGPSIDLGAIEVRFLAASPDSAHLVAAGFDRLGVAHVVGLSPADLAKSGDRTVSGGVIGLAALDDGRAAVAQATGVALVDPATGASQSIAAPAALSGAMVATSAGVIAA